MKKNLTKKLMLSVLTLAFAVVSLGASTFAWFTVSENAKVESFEMNVTAEAGIEIAVGDVHGTNKSAYFINSLKSDAVYKVLNALSFENFMNVTAYDGTDAVVDGEFYDLNGTSPVSESAGYVALRFYLKADQDGQVTVTIPWLVNVTGDNPATTEVVEDWSAAVTAWSAGMQYTRGDGTNVDSKYAADSAYKYDVLSAARMAILFDDPTTGTDDALPAETFKVFQATKADLTSNLYGNTLGFGEGEYGALEIYNGKFSTTKDFEKVAFPGKLDSSAQYTADAAKYVINVTRDVVYTFDYYIWLEGFDAECVNAIFAQKISASLSFQFA